MRLLAALFALFFTLGAETFEYSDEPDEVAQKVIYQDYVKLPERVFKGEIFPVTVKTLSTQDHFTDISYKFSQGQGVSLVSETPERSIRGNYFYDTFYFLATSRWLRTPDITASLQYSRFHKSGSTTLKGKSIDVVALNPGADFSNVLAESFEITKYKTTRYNRSSNIAVFTIKALRSDLEAFGLKHAVKQGVESIESSPSISKMTYYAIIPKNIENLTFTYFNLKSETFVPVLIPIIIDDDTVSTQSDITPVDHKHTMIKITIAGAVAFIGIVLLMVRRKLLYALLVIIPGLYITYAAVPIQYVCLKAQSPIYLLPMERGTVFETTTRQYSLEVQGSVDAFTKVKLENNTIGWVNNEDICTP